MNQFDRRMIGRQSRFAFVFQARIVFVIFSAVGAASFPSQRSIRSWTKSCPRPQYRTKRTGMFGDTITTRSTGTMQPLSFVGHLFMCSYSQRGRICNHANRSTPMCTRRKWRGPAALSMSAKKSSATSQFTPLPFLNMASSTLSPGAMSYSTTNNEECALPPDTEDNFSRYSKFLVKNSNGVDGMGGVSNESKEQKETIYWLDTLGEDQCFAYPNGFSESSLNPNAPRPFSVLSWNILAQTLYEAQYQRRKIQQVALSSTTQPQTLPSLTSSPHPHPWPKRLKRIIEILSHSNSDIICLQECEAQSFKDDLVPALSKYGYDGIAQEDARSDKPTSIKEKTKHRDPRNHIVATFWKRDKFEPVGEALVRSRTMTTVLRLKGDTSLNGGEEIREATPNVAVVNVHLEGHPRRFSQRTHQLQHAMSDISKRIENEKKHPSQIENDPTRIGKLNALVLAGDFNCELQSSACSTYLQMGRLGRQAGLGGIHGEDSLVLPPSLLESTEATGVIRPIMEWGRALPEEEISDVNPHPFRRNGMTSAYPAWLGRDDANSHFTFCSELSKRPVPGLDQLWFTSMTLERTALRRMFNDCDTGLWERYFYDDAEVEKRREDERRKVLASGLPSLKCEYPSDHLPIGARFEWKWDECGDSCLLNDCEEDDEECSVDHCVNGGEVRGLNVVDSEGNDVQDDTLQEQLHREQKRTQEHTFETPHEELEYLLHSCPYDSAEQRSDVEFILSPLDPPMSLTTKEKPTPDQMKQLEARREKKAEVLKTASLGVRPWLKKFWKVNKDVGKWDRRKAVQEAKLLEKAMV